MSYSQWLADHALGDLFRKYITENLQAYGMEAAVVAILAPVLAYVGVKAFWGIVSPAPEPDWRNLHPANDEMMRKAFDDLHTVVRLASILKEDTANTFEEFQSQIRRAGLYR